MPLKLLFFVNSLPKRVGQVVGNIHCLKVTYLFFFFCVFSSSLMIAINENQQKKVTKMTCQMQFSSIGCPTTYQTRQFFNNFTTDTYRHNFTTETFLFISHTTNLLLFKSRCNIFIGFGIIKELPGLVGSGTPCISTVG